MCVICRLSVLLLHQLSFHGFVIPLKDVTTLIKAYSLVIFVIHLWLPCVAFVIHSFFQLLVQAYFLHFIERCILTLKKHWKITRIALWCYHTFRIATIIVIVALYRAIRFQRVYLIVWIRTIIPLHMLVFYKHSGFLVLIKVLSARKVASVSKVSSFIIY